MDNLVISQPLGGQVIDFSLTTNATLLTQPSSNIFPRTTWA